MDNATTLQTVTATLVSNREKWSWLADLTDEQIATLANVVSKNISDEFKRATSNNRRLGFAAQDWNEAQIAAFTGALSRGHASMLFG